jgi:hypothetical protein
LIDRVLVPVPRPGFQKKYETPRCRVHGIEMKKVGMVADDSGTRVRRWRCPRTGCDQIDHRDSEGNEVDRKRPPLPMRRERICRIPECGKTVHRPLDLRSRHCAEHSRLTYVERHRLMKKVLRKFLTDIGRRYGPELVGEGAHNAMPNDPFPGRDGRAIEFACWLRKRIAVAGLKPKDAIRSSEWSWYFAKSLPRGQEEFRRLGRLLKCSMKDWEEYMVRTYGGRRRA